MPEIIPNWHPLVVHFAIALLSTAVVFFVLGRLLARHRLGPSLTQIARWNLGIGTAAAAVAVATGWQAYGTVAHDPPSHANMTVHMRWALGTLAAFLLAAAVAWWDRHRVAGAGALLLVVLIPAAAALAVTGWYGSENVYRYGLGVMRLPTPEGGGHEHGAAMPGMDMQGHDRSGAAPAAGGGHEHGSRGTNQD